MKQGILVLGMHRSGTSALTRVLNLLGCALPDNLIGPGDGNVLGHWEAVEAVTLNDEILASAGSSWEDWGPINDDWRQSGLRPEMLQRITVLIAQHADLGPLFALKDPRLCRLADLWLEGMDAAGVEPLVVLQIRNPLEVIRSLESRDLMTPGYGQLLWLRHVLDAEFASRGRKRVVCRYDQMMRNWHGLVARIKSGLDVALPRNSPAARAEVDSFLSAEQRHQEIDLDLSLEDLWLSDWVRRTLAILVRWSEQGEDQSDFSELDGIRHQFDNAYGALAALFLDNGIVGSVGSGSRLKAELSEQIGIAQRAADEAKVRVQQAETEQAAAVAVQAEQALLLREKVAELMIEVQAGQTRYAELEVQLQALDAVRQELHGREVQNAELSGRLSSAESSLAQRQEELAQLWEKLRSVAEAAGAAQADVEQERRLRLELEDRVKAFDLDARDLRSKLDEAGVENANAQSKLALRSDEIAQLTETLREQEVAAQAFDQARSDLELEMIKRKEEEAARIAVEQKLATRFDEITKLTKLLVDEGGKVSKAAADADWLRQMSLVAENFPKWWAAMPKKLRRRLQHLRYSRAGLFDAQSYIEQYPDVGQDGMDPVRHYIMHGMLEGRTRAQ